MQDVAPANRFMLVRAAPAHPDQWLVNRLIAQLVPRDFVSRFVFDKQGFYDAYERYSEKFREYVVATLDRHISQGQGGLPPQALRPQRGIGHV